MLGRSPHDTCELRARLAVANAWLPQRRLRRARLGAVFTARSRFAQVPESQAVSSDTEPNKVISVSSSALLQLRMARSLRIKERPHRHRRLGACRADKEATPDDRGHSRLPVHVHCLPPLASGCCCQRKPSGRGTARTPARGIGGRRFFAKTERPFASPRSLLVPEGPQG